MPTPDEYAEIKHWVRINRSIIRDVYHIFINICNHKYGLKLYDSKYLYNDMCIYFYYALRDDYGNLLFESMREKREYMNSMYEEERERDRDRDQDEYDDYEFDIDEEYISESGEW